MDRFTGGCLAQRQACRVGIPIPGRHLPMVSTAAKTMGPFSTLPPSSLRMR